MHAAIVVVHEVERNLVRVVLEFLGESVCQAGKTAPNPTSRSPSPSKLCLR
jgi:hypothetical protein